MHALNEVAMHSTRQVKCMSEKRDLTMHTYTYDRGNISYHKAITLSQTSCSYLRCDPGIIVSWHASPNVYMDVLALSPRQVYITY